MVVDVFGNELQRLLTSVELYAAVQFVGQSAQPFQPAVEARLKLSAAGHGYADAAQGVQRLYEAREHNLPVQAIVETLDEVAPELGVLVGMDVHAHDDLGAVEFAEGMLDTVGNVGGQSHLRLQFHFRCRGLPFQLLKQLQSLFAVDGSLLVIIDYVQGHQPSVEPLVAHQYGLVQQLRGNFGVLDTDEYLLVVGMGPMRLMSLMGGL